MIMIVFFKKRHFIMVSILSISLTEFWMPIIIIYSFDIFHHPLPLKKKNILLGWNHLSQKPHHSSRVVAMEVVVFLDQQNMHNCQSSKILT